MSNITHYENLIQEKRKKTPFREFIKELWSWDILNLYKRNGRICRYPESDRIKKLGDTFWEDAPSYWKKYDFWSSFFENFRLLQDDVPMQYTLQFGTNENCEYMDWVFLGKNVYLSFIIWFGAENILYSAFSYINVTNVMNSFLVAKNSSEVADSIGVSESYKVFYSKNIVNCSDIWFSTNLIGCQECIGCDALENQKYRINNIQYSEIEYRKKKEEILRDKNSFQKIWKHIQKKEISNFASENVSGNGITKSSNIETWLWISNIHNGRNVAISNGNNGCRNIYDGIDIGLDVSDYYGVVGAGGEWTGNVYCSYQIADSSFIYYSSYLQGSNHCIGCIWLKNKSYCILNKQYTKEEWEILAEKIFASMEADGTLGEFFPASMNPFYFNDTLAYLIDDSFTQEEIEAEWYLWRGEPIRADIPEGMRVVKNSELDQFQGFCSIRHPEWNEGSMGMDSSLRQNDGTRWSEWYIDPAIMNVVISDEKWNYYRIVKMEYDFLMKHALPLPTLHWLDRMKMGFQ